MKKIMVGILFLISGLLVGTANSAEYPGAFHISSVFLSNATNFHFRIYSDNPGSWLCSNGPRNPSWGYINEADSGAKGKIAALLEAYAMGKTITATTIGVPYNGSTYCQIIEFQISN
jgi:hypothetical protein